MRFFKFLYRIDISQMHAEVWKIDLNTFQKLFGRRGFNNGNELGCQVYPFIVKQRSTKYANTKTHREIFRLISEQPQLLKQFPLQHIATFLGVIYTSPSKIRNMQILSYDKIFQFITCYFSILN